MKQKDDQYIRLSYFCLKILIEYIDNSEIPSLLKLFYIFFGTLLFANSYQKMIFLKWRLGVVVIDTAQLHLTKAELRFCAGSNSGHGVSEIHDGEDL